MQLGRVHERCIHDWCQKSLASMILTKLFRAAVPPTSDMGLQLKSTSVHNTTLSPARMLPYSYSALYLDDDDAEA